MMGKHRIGIEVRLLSKPDSLPVAWRMGSFFVETKIEVPSYYDSKA